MNDQQLARALHGSGTLTAEQLQTAARSRHQGETLARSLVRLGLLQPDDILRHAPHAFNEPENEPQHAPVPMVPAHVATPAPGRPAAAMGLGNEERTAVDGDFIIEGGDDSAYDPAQAPVVRWANELLKLAINMGASDVHLEPQPDGLLPRYRIDGALRSGNLLPLDFSAAIISRLKVVANIDITENRLPQDGRFRARCGHKTFDFRVSTLPGIHGEKVVLRLLDHSSLVTDLARLGFSETEKATVERMLGRTHGLILVTGPTGSGKTTTLYAALASTRDETKNVITVEDPVEYELAGVTQTSAHSEIGLTFARALRAILRQDPDVILVGEIRDDETADVAVRAALTGHLVLSTLHTNSAVAAITRLQDMGVPPYLISSAVTGILAQRLVRMNCRHCRAQMTPTEAEREEYAAFFDMPLDATYVKGAGCEACGGTGVKGRVAVLEMLEVGASLRKAISGRMDLDILRGAARSEGMRTLRDDARAKILAGHIAPDEALRVLMGQEE